MFSSTKKKQISSRKTKKQLIHSGGGLFSITPKTYNNVRYGKSGFVTPVLTCLQCKNNIFRHHKVVTDSRLRAAVLGDDAQLFGKKNNTLFAINAAL